MKNIVLAALATIGLLVAWPACAQRSAPCSPVGNTAADKMSGAGAQVVLLGTAGGPVIWVGRSQPANLVIVDGCPYLVDAGDRTVLQLAAAGFRPSDIQALFLTHLHFDHTAGLPALIGFRWMTRRAAQLPIYGPPATLKLADGAAKFLQVPLSLHAGLPPGPSLEDSYSVHEIDIQKPTVIYSDDRVRVTAVENTHFSTPEDGANLFAGTRSYALRFDTASRSIVFTGDTGPSDAIVNLAKGADLLVVETMDLPRTLAMVRGSFGSATPQQLAAVEHYMQHNHLLPSEIGKLATNAGVGMVVLSHLSPPPQDDRDFGRLTAQVREFYKGPAVVGQDLERF